ncbi:MAG: septum formation initiator family protein [Candidatus Doudnabacteria bacterium]|nr:septum formation initiator family protein [Candidatus Doudnabacteria bacterium]
MAKLQIYLKKWLNTDNLTRALIVPGLILIVVLNLVRTISDAQRNYQVYLAEQELLGYMQQENADLKQELAYYQSYEYKKLYARDNLRLAEPGERLYRIEGAPQLYQPREKTYDPFRAEVSWQWWEALVL